MLLGCRYKWLLLYIYMVHYSHICLRCYSLNNDCVRYQKSSYARIVSKPISPPQCLGETYIDLEDRVFTQYRPTCGIQQSYELFVHPPPLSLFITLYLK